MDTWGQLVEGLSPLNNGTKGSFVPSITKLGIVGLCHQQIDGPLELDIQLCILHKKE